MSARTEVVKVNLWPDRAKKPYYWRAIVFESRRAMEIYWAQAAEISGQDPTPDFLAITLSTTILTIRVVKTRKKKNGRSIRKWIQDHCLGQILFYRQRLGGGIVAHECGHAAFRYAENILKIKAKDLYHGGKMARRRCPEEQIMSCLGSMVSQFWRQFYARAPKEWMKPVVEL